MKATDEKKLKKALEMMRKVEQMINDVAASDSKFRYSSNKNFRDNRISAAVSIIECEVNSFCQ